MGCCLSSTATAPAAAADPKAKCQAPDAPSPPPPPPPPHPAVEEETVKEVLSSETPIITKKPPPATIPPLQPPVGDTQILQSQVDDEEGEVKDGNGVVSIKKTTDENQENVSEISEIYSYSESFSAATTVTVTDNRRDEIEADDDGEVTQKVNRSPPAKMVPRKKPTASSADLAGKERVRGIRTPAKRPVPSPEKKAGQLPSRTTTTAQRHRNVAPSNGVRRRELPARRSRSPALRSEAGQRRNAREGSPAAGKLDSPTPVSVNTEESEGKKVKLEKADNKSPSTAPEPETSESLENPLVSLECFIFL